MSLTTFTYPQRSQQLSLATQSKLKWHKQYAKRDLPLMKLPKPLYKMIIMSHILK